MAHAIHGILSTPPKWMKIHPVQPGFLLERIATGEPFSLSRWGDGEWYSVLSHPGQNSDHQPYHGATLGQALREILQSRPEYMLGPRFPNQKGLQLAVPHWLKDNGLTDYEWYDIALVWHDLSINGELPALVKALNSRPLILVGPPHLKAAHKWLDTEAFIEVSLQDAWAKSSADLVPQIERELNSVHRPAIVGFCCGMTANVIIDRLYQAYGTQHYFLDLGSVFDPYVDYMSRLYHRRPEFREVMKRVRAELNAEG